MESASLSGMCLRFEPFFVVTGNHRAWRHVIKMRATEAADREIREVAVEIFNQLKYLEPSIYQDGEVADGVDGYQVVRWRQL